MIITNDIPYIKDPSEKVDDSWFNPYLAGQCHKTTPCTLEHVKTYNIDMSFEAGYKHMIDLGYVLEKIAIYEGAITITPMYISKYNCDSSPEPKQKYIDDMILTGWLPEEDGADTSNGILGTANKYVFEANNACKPLEYKEWYVPDPHPNCEGTAETGRYFRNIYTAQHTYHFVQCTLNCPPNMHQFNGICIPNDGYVPNPNFETDCTDYVVRI